MCGEVCFLWFRDEYPQWSDVIKLFTKITDFYSCFILVPSEVIPNLIRNTKLICKTKLTKMVSFCYKVSLYNKTSISCLVQLLFVWYTYMIVILLPYYLESYFLLICFAAHFNKTWPKESRWAPKETGMFQMSTKFRILSRRKMESALGRNF